MSLPLAFENPEDYFEEILKFFEEYQYLYSIPNVDILIHDILDKIEINTEKYDIFDENIDLSTINDDFLIRFFTKLKRFQVFYHDVEEKDMDFDINVPVSPKKRHEIVYIVNEIKQLCETINCSVVVDFGSGLGYLDQLLFERTNYKVLGLECNESHYVGAKKRQRKYHENSLEHVKYIKHTINRESHEKIQVFLEEKIVDHKKFCITGLHACADLTIDAIDIFLKMNTAQAIAIMPCCYHKMAGNEDGFKNFPLSKCLNDIFDRCKGEYNMKVPFLRLAAQPPCVDEKIKDLVFNLLSRALLQLYAHKHNCKLKRNKRKPVKTKTMDNNIDAYIEDASSNGFTLIKKEPILDDNKVENRTFNVEELITLWNEITPEKFKMAAVYIILQNNLQPVVENFVLYDRLCYLKENGIKHCAFKKILNEKTSPRCLALIAYKQDL